MTISAEEVKHVANLSKLSFNEDELQDFTVQLGKIIDMVMLYYTAELSMTSYPRAIPNNNNVLGVI